MRLVLEGRPDAEEALRPQARAGSHQAAARGSGAAGREVIHILSRMCSGPFGRRDLVERALKMLKGDTPTTATATAH
jgi:hypothetical protein